jgi:hypothetical protein
MQFVKAFEHLGYTLLDQRQDWSAEKADGVCISLWAREMGTRGGLLWMNTRVHADPIEGWGSKGGNRRRIGHLRRALDQFGGRVDTVIVSGVPGVGYGTAQPWIAEGNRSGTFWQVTHLDDETGHFEVVLRQQHAVS